MKLQTHPELTSTSIQLKNGSFYQKKWLFFRPKLRLEIDTTSHKTWNVKKIQVDTTSSSTEFGYMFKKLPSH